MTQNKLQPFNALTVPLQQTNLIEASAGTGKTYSIAILVLRLIVEENMELKEILMVTFTKAAVAELETRIRKFIRQGFNYALGYNTSDKNIREVIDTGIKKLEKEEVLLRLKKARLQLDQTSIFTIHSFCQKSLNEFAFETGQLFDSEVIENESQLIENAVNEHWRKEITTLDSEILRILLDKGLSRSQMIGVVTKALSGKKFVCKNPFDYEKGLSQISNSQAKLNQAIEAFKTLFENNGEKSHVENNGNAMKTFGGLLNDADAFRDKLIEKQNTGYVSILFPELLSAALNCSETNDQLSENACDVIYYLYHKAIELTEGEIAKTKQELTLFSFNDLITKMHAAINSANSAQLISNLQKKYKAAFIDEFQDTDKYQYEIFSTVFSNSIVFYIGDPKQSIYRFRGADIETYLKAANKVHHAYTMGHNFRSTPNLIKGLNTFFGNVTNPFNDTHIQYEAVSNGLNLHEMEYETIPQKPISIFNEDTKDKIAAQVSYKVLELLTKDNTINNRKIKPSDIGILVKSKLEGKNLKGELSKLNIQSITIDDSNVWETTEAILVKYILTAIVTPNKANINRALLNYLTSQTKLELINPNNEIHLENFRLLNKAFAINGVFSTLNQFLEMYHVQSHVFKTNPDNGERILSNLLQLNELLHKKEVQSELSPMELLMWLGKIQTDDSALDEDYTLRLESDEDAVQIVTIHKSKGLAYNIVIAPYLDLKVKTDYTLLDYKNPDTDEYCFSFYKTEQELEWYSLQTEQENRRLIYVALTRAVYHCFIYQNTSNKGGNGSIKTFIDAIEPNEFIEMCDSLPEPLTKYVEKVDEMKPLPIVFTGKINNHWQVSSFSRLSDKHAYLGGGDATGSDAYSQFVFKEMPRGMLAGHFLHSLFEHADFQQENNELALKTANKLFPLVKQDKLVDDYQQLIHHTLNAKLGNELDFKLADISNANKLKELEFYFSSHAFTMQKLAGIIPNFSSDNYAIMEGLMHGFIDLIFRHNGKYYILDWKSNHLGSSLDDYTHDKLELAIIANNYHLQYIIYTVALVRYLKAHIPNFNYNEHFGGVLYVFLRGCRTNLSSGVYYIKPEEEFIVEVERILK